MRFDIILVRTLKHHASQERPERARTPPKRAPESLQEAIKNGSQFLLFFIPNLHKNGPIDGPQSQYFGPEILRIIDNNHLGHLSGPRWPQDDPQKAQDAPRCATMGQDGTKMAQYVPKTTPR